MVHMPHIVWADSWANVFLFDYFSFTISDQALQAISHGAAWAMAS